MTRSKSKKRHLDEEANPLNEDVKVRGGKKSKKNKEKIAKKRKNENKTSSRKKAKKQEAAAKKKTETYSANNIEKAMEKGDDDVMMAEEPWVMVEKTTTSSAAPSSKKKKKTSGKKKKKKSGSKKKESQKQKNKKKEKESRGSLASPIEISPIEENILESAEYSANSKESTSPETESTSLLAENLASAAAPGFIPKPTPLISTAADAAVEAENENDNANAEEAAETKDDLMSYIISKITRLFYSEMLGVVLAMYLTTSIAIFDYDLSLFTLPMSVFEVFPKVFQRIITPFYFWSSFNCSIYFFALTKFWNYCSIFYADLNQEMKQTAHYRFMRAVHGISILTVSTSYWVGDVEPEVMSSIKVRTILMFVSYLCAETVYFTTKMEFSVSRLSNHPARRFGFFAFMWIGLHYSDAFGGNKRQELHALFISTIGSAIGQCVCFAFLSYKKQVPENSRIDRVLDSISMCLSLVILLQGTTLKDYFNSLIGRS